MRGSWMLGEAWECVGDAGRRGGMVWGVCVRWVLCVWDWNVLCRGPISVDLSACEKALFFSGGSLGRESLDFWTEYGSRFAEESRRFSGIG